MKKNSLMKNKKFAIYAKKNLVQTKVIKVNLKYYVKLKIIVITHENLEELLIVIAIYVNKYQERFL